MKKLNLYAFLIISFASISFNDVYAISVSDISKAVKNNKSLSSANATDIIEQTMEDSIKSGVNEFTKEVNKNVKSIIDSTKGEVKGVISEAKKDMNSVVESAKKEIGSIQGTVQDVKNTIYSVKASFDKIIILLKVLIGLVGILITLISISFLGKIIKILKLTKSVVSIAKGQKDK